MKRIKASSLIVPVTEVTAKAISFVNVLLLIRIFSIGEYADYSYLISVILWASVLMDSGINDLIYNKSLKNDSSDLDSLFTGKIILSFIVVLLLSGFFVFKIPKLFLPGFLLSLVILFSSLSAFIKMYARGKHLIEIDLITILSEPLIRLFFLIIVFLSNSVIHWRFDQVFIVYLLAGIIAFTINYYRLNYADRFRLLKEHLKDPLIKIRIIIEKTKYFLLYYLMLIGLQRLDIIMLEKYSSKENLAIFSTAVTIYQVIYLFFYALITAKILFLIKNTKHLYLYLLPVLLFIVFITFLSSPYLYNLLFPQEYFNGYKVLNFLMFSIIPAAFSLFFIIKNNYEGKVKQNFYFIASVLTLKFIIYYILKQSDLYVYYTVYGITELLLFLIFIIYSKFNESTSDQ